MRIAITAHAFKNSSTAVGGVLGDIDDKSFPVEQRHGSRRWARDYKRECCPRATSLNYDNATVKDEDDAAVWVNSNAAFNIRPTLDGNSAKELPVAVAQHVDKTTIVNDDDVACVELELRDWKSVSFYRTLQRRTPSRWAAHWVVLWRE